MTEKMNSHIIIGVHVTDRNIHAGQVQEVLTEFGNLIKTRLGIHEVGEEFSSTNGILILELLDDEERAWQLIEKLRLIEGVEVKKMIFEHP